MTATFEDVVAHRDAMVDVFTEITQDCVLLGLTPCTIIVSRWSNGTLDVGVQLNGTDTAAVDAFADSYGLSPDDGVSNYTRVGRVDVDGRRVEVRAFTGRPKAPAFPAGYAPQAVEA